jgi:hypothetical protein
MWSLSDSDARIEYAKVRTILIPLPSCTKLGIENSFTLRHGRLETHPVSERRQNHRIEAVGRLPLDSLIAVVVSSPGLGVTKVPT